MASYIITGNIRNAQNTPLRGLQVHLYAVTLGREHLLGQDRTKGQGQYRIQFTLPDNAPDPLNTPMAGSQIFIRVLGADGAQWDESGLISANNPQLTLNRVIANPPAEKPLYRRLAGPVNEQLKAAGMNLVNLSNRDFTLLRQSLGEADTNTFSDSNLNLLRLSGQLEAQTGLPAELLFAMPLDDYNDPDALAGLSDNDIRHYYDQAVQIEKIGSLDIDNALVRWENLRLKQGILRNKRLAFQVLDEASQAPLEYCQVQVVQTRNNRDLGQIWTDQQGLAVFRFNGSTNEPEYFRVQVVDESGQPLLENQVEEYGDIIILKVSLPATGDTSPRISELANALNWSLPSELVQFLDSKEIQSLDGLRRAGGFNAMMSDLPPLADASYLSRLEAHAEWQAIWDDYTPEQAEKILGAGYRSIAQIASTTRVRFMARAGELLGDYTAARLHREAQAAHLVAQNTLTASRVRAANPLESGCPDALTAVSPAAYLAAMARYIQKEVQLGETQSGEPVTVALEDLEDVFRQPFQALPIEENAVEERVVQARISVEVLRRYLRDKALPGSGSEQESAWRQAYRSYREDVYLFLLADLGVSYEELRATVRGNDSEQVSALNRRLGFTDNAVLAQLFLDSTSLSEADLERLFGFQDTTRDSLAASAGDPLVLSWRIDRWNNLAGVKAGEVMPLDPDAIGEAWLANPVVGDEAYELWTSRKNWIEDRLATLRNAAPGAAPLARLDNLIEQANILLDQEQPAVSPEARNFLINFWETLTQPGITPLQSEWAEVYDIILGVQKAALASVWKSEEEAAGIVLGPKYFRTPEAFIPDNFSAWRVDTEAVRIWRNALDLCTREYQEISEIHAGLIRKAEQRYLPRLRDALISASDAVGNSLKEKADWLTERLLIQFRLEGNFETTRIAQAIDTLQKLLWSIHNNQVVGDFASWKILSDDFLEEWRWIGSYARWKALMMVYLYPENNLHPALRRRQSKAFEQVIQTYRDKPRLTPSDICEQVAAYEEIFYDLPKLKVEATCQARIQNPTPGRCGESGGLQTDYVMFLFARAEATQSVYWSIYSFINPEPEAQQTPWQRIPSLENIAQVLGASVYEFGNNRFIYLFVKEKNRGIERLLWLQFNLDSLSFEETDPIEFGLLGEASNFTAVINQQNNSTIPPSFALQIDESIDIYQFNKLGTTYASLYKSPWNAQNTTIKSMVSFDYFPNQGEYAPSFILMGNNFSNAGQVDAMYKFGRPDKSDGDPLRSLLGGYELIGATFWPGPTNQIIVFLKKENNTYGKIISLYNGEEIKVYPENEAFYINDCQYVDFIAVNTSAQSESVGVLPIVLHISDPANERRNGSQLGEFTRNESIVSRTVRNSSIRRERNSLNNGLVDDTLDTWPGGIPPPDTQPEPPVNPYIRLEYTTRLTPAYMEKVSLHPAFKTVPTSLRRIKVWDILQNNATYAPFKVHFEEAFFHLPLLTAQNLHKRGYYEEALQWFRLVYDYTQPAGRQKVYPGLIQEENHDSERSLDNTLFTDLNPHDIARTRLHAYTRYTLQSIIRCILDYGDSEFTRDNQESVSRALSLYQLAQRLMPLLLSPDTSNPIPEPAPPGAIELPPRGSFSELITHVNTRQVVSLTPSNARAGAVAAKIAGRDFEVTFSRLTRRGADTLRQTDLPWLKQKMPAVGLQKPVLETEETRVVQHVRTIRAAAAEAPLAVFRANQQLSVPFIPDSGIAFCVPLNPSWAALHHRIELNLSKILQGRNIAGLERTLDHYAAPIDAEATNEQVGAVNLDGFQSPTLYRYRYLLERAKQVAALAQQMESTFLSILEKRDAENYNLLKARQDIGLSSANVRIQSLKLQEAKEGIQLSKLQKYRAEIQYKYYQKLIDKELSGLEIASLAAKVGQLALPIISVAISGAGISTWKDYFKSNKENFDSILGKSGDIFSSISYYQKREEEWRHARDLAKQDVRIGEQQIKMSKIRADISGQELFIANLQAANSRETLDFLLNKFTNFELYDWMSSVLEEVYSSVLQQATAVAQLAARQLGFERQAPVPAYIQSNYWEAPLTMEVGALSDNGAADRRGLTGSSRLLRDIYQLDQYTIDTETRKRQLTKTISLAQMSPIAFQQFRETGNLFFVTPMEMFDRDFPGHYLRLIKRVRVSLIALTSPVDGIKATLIHNGISRVVTALGNSFRGTEIRRTPESVALTSPVNAGGQFDFEVQVGDHLFPFEGHGVASSWQIELPKAANAFDYDSIADVLITLDYTALLDDSYKQQVVQRLNRSLESDRFFSFRREFSDTWYDLNHPELVEDVRKMVVGFEALRGDFPPNLNKLSLQQVVLYFVRKDGFQEEIPLRHLRFQPQDSFEWLGGQDDQGLISVNGVLSSRTGSFDIWDDFRGRSPVGTWEMALPNSDDVVALFRNEQIEDILLAISYTGETPGWDS